MGQEPPAATSEADRTAASRTTNRRRGRREFLRGASLAASIGALSIGAASRVAADDEDTSLPNEIVIVNDDERNEADVTYRFTVSGEVEALSEPGGDDAEDDTASGIPSTRGRTDTTTRGRSRPSSTTARRRSCGTASR